MPAHRIAPPPIPLPREVAAVDVEQILAPPRHLPLLMITMSGPHKKYVMPDQLAYFRPLPVCDAMRERLRRESEQAQAMVREHFKDPTPSVSFKSYLDHK